jgi:hypothetical protein
VSTDCQRLLKACNEHSIFDPAEKCFVGHGQHLKRNSVHAKNRSGFRKRRRSHLTVVVRELEALKAEKVKAVSCYTVWFSLDFEFFSLCLLSAHSLTGMSCTSSPDVRHGHFPLVTIEGRSL